MTSMINVFRNVLSGKHFWLSLLIFSVVLESTALVYQYLLDYPPCVLCIHVRIYFVLVILVSIAGLIMYSSSTAQLSASFFSLLLFVGLAERSYQLLGTERGFVFSECNMELGLPSWLALDQWFPFIFEIHTSCGYTPELLFAITMAEALIVISVLLVLITIVRLFFLLSSKNKV